jgi:pSer/pThr/pTyr-binding forkhead associated (FHA) protein
MKIRLKIISPGGQSRVFEHEGDALCVGRDPSCELLLEGDEGTAASRQHARIELAPSGATLVDLGSANKTQHNEQVVQRPTPLRPGDRVQIGFTGAQLVVLDLDLTRPAAKPGVNRRVLLVAGAGVAAFAVVAALLLLWPRGPRKGDDPVVAVRTDEKKDKEKPKPANGGEGEGQGEKKKPEEKEREPEEKGKGKEEPPPPPPAAHPDIRVVGNYLVPKGTRSSVLMQRYSEDKPWTVLRSGEAVSTGQTLVSLPGYESVVSLQSGVKLNLWGSLPQFSSPVNESVVMLRIPEAGVDADVILDRGRIEIGNQKPKGACVVRVNFLREHWDVTLKGPDSRVVAELITRLAGTPDDVRLLGLFSQGDVAVKTRTKEYNFAMPARLAWLSSSPDEIFEERLREVPSWWAKPVELTPEVKETLLFLRDWAEGRFHAAKPDADVTYAILEGARDATKDPKERELGLWFLSALDAPVTLVEFLSDPDQVSASIRTAAMMGLQDWLRRNGPLRNVLVRQLQQRFSYPTAVAGQLVRLAATIPEEEREKPGTYQELIELLDHDNQVLRHLAFWQLYQGLRDRRPAGADKIPYDPLADKKDRQAAVKAWQKLVPAGKVPPRRPDTSRP